MATGASRQALPLTVASLLMAIRTTHCLQNVDCKPEISVTAIARYKPEPHAVRTQAVTLRSKRRGAQRREGDRYGVEAISSVRRSRVFDRDRQGSQTGGRRC